MRGEYTQKENGVAMIRPADQLDLAESLVRIKVAAGLRAVVIDCSGEVLRGLDRENIAARIGILEVPVVSAVAGEVSGWLSYLTSASHLCFAEAGASFFFEDEPGGTQFPEMSGKAIQRDEAEREGLINRLPRHETAVGMALKTADKIATMAPLAVRACLESIGNSENGDFSCGLENEVRLFAELFETQDMKRGTAAFFAKLAPDFEGN